MVPKKWLRGRAAFYHDSIKNLWAKENQSDRTKPNSFHGIHQAGVLHTGALKHLRKTRSPQSPRPKKVEKRERPGKTGLYQTGTEAKTGKSKERAAARRERRGYSRHGD